MAETGGVTRRREGERKEELGGSKRSEKHRGKEKEQGRRRQSQSEAGS